MCQILPTKTSEGPTTLWCIHLANTYRKLEEPIVTGNPLPQAGLFLSVRCLLFTLTVVMLVQPHHVGAPGGVGQAEVPRLREKGYLQGLPYRR